MKPTIIVADDSQTIQKVIKITLANENYDLIECLSYNDLSEKVQANSADIVLLDFNLSDDKTGYDIAQEVRRNSAHTKFMMLYGTFDTIDEALLEASGVDQYIVKPFDGTKFISSCRQLVSDIELESEKEDTSVVEEDFPSIIEEDKDLDEMTAKDADDDFDEQWIVNQPTLDDVDEDPIQEKPMIITGEEMNSLERDMQDWGIEVPGIIGNETASENFDLPPVIESISPETDFEMKDHALPSDDDLDFPDTEAVIQKVEAESEEKSREPKLTPISSLNIQEETTDAYNDFDFDSEVGVSTDEELSKIEDQIADEADEDLWQADEVYHSESVETQSDPDPSIEDITPLRPHTLEEVSLENFNSTELEDTKINLDDIPSDFPIDAMDEPQSDVQFYGGHERKDDDLEAKIESIVTPIIEKIVKETIEKQFQDSSNRVAWEVIPDLAENLIKKELKSISDKILNQER